MTNPIDQAQMTTGDFQRLLQIALSDLSIRRTLMENQIHQLEEAPHTLEQENAIDQLDQQIQRIATDYRHYQRFVDPELAAKIKVDYD
ncbi:hypothetical protein ACFQ5M_07265 [Agrilactobacillus yilanensis]|uniref:Uncharacterized protein n=1 Tax=Agrilactobacillus yilanensis TaxID=2485997 RepID=A0ABW4JAE9_9LACO|nr:hypothetical protein [Agrilactobacillus yilanensis]